MDSPKQLDYEPKGRRRFPLRLAILLVLVGVAGGSVPAVRWMNRSRRFCEITYDMKCRSNLRQIGNAIVIYSYEFGPKLPDSLPVIAANEEVTGQVLVCGASVETPAAGPTTQALIDDMSKPGHSSYVYLGGGLVLTNLPADAVLAYEPGRITA